jgi:hypothetical protein
MDNLKNNNRAHDRTRRFPGGEGGIRTRGRGLSPGTHLAGEPNRPLWHLPMEGWILYHLETYYSVLPGGGRGIRTPGGLATTTDFKSVALNHSAIPPEGKILPYLANPFQHHHIANHAIFQISQYDHN